MTTSAEPSDQTNSAVGPSPNYMIVLSSRLEGLAILHASTKSHSCSGSCVIVRTSFRLPIPRELHALQTMRPNRQAVRLRTSPMTSILDVEPELHTGLDVACGSHIDDIGRVVIICMTTASSCEGFT